MTSQEQVDSFFRFATEQLASGRETPVEELFDQWYYETLRPDASAENVAAVRAAIEDMNNGDKGRDAGLIEQSLRQELGLPAFE